MTEQSSSRFQLFLRGEYRAAGFGRASVIFQFLEPLFSTLATPLFPFLFLALLAGPGNILRLSKSVDSLRGPARILKWPAKLLIGYNKLFLFGLIPAFLCLCLVIALTTFPIKSALLIPLFILLRKYRTNFPYRFFAIGLIIGLPLIMRYNQFDANDFQAIAQSQYVRPLISNDRASERHSRDLIGRPVLVREMISSPDGKFIFVTNFDQMDRSEHTILPAVLKIPVEQPAAEIQYLSYTYSQEMAYDTRRDLIYLAGHSADKLVSLTISPLAVSAEVEVPDKPHNLIYDDQRDLVYLFFESSRLQVFEAGSLKLINNLPSSLLMMGPFSPVFLQKSGLIAVVSGLPGYQLGLFDIEGEKPNRYKTFGLGSYGLSWSPERNSFFTTDFFTGMLYEIDFDTLDIERSKFVGSGPRSLIYDRRRGLVYVSRFFSESLSIYSADDFRLISTVPIGYNVRDMVLNGAGRLFAGSSAGVFEVLIDDLARDAAKLADND